MNQDRNLLAFTIVEIAMVTTIVAVVIFVVSSSLSITQKRGKVVRTDHDTETAKFTGVMGSTDNSIAFPADIALATGNKKSCKEILDAGQSTGSGEYTIDPDGTGTAAGSFKVYCDMDTTHGGGGWTLVTAQYEDSSTANWNTGINEATFTAPTTAMLDNCGNSSAAGNGCNLANAAGFALSTSQLPTGTTQTAFGKGSDATFKGYSAFTYTTGNIHPHQRITNIKDGLQYDISRSTQGWYDWNNPEESFTTNSGAVYANAFTYDLYPGRNCTYAFNIQHNIQSCKMQILDGCACNSDIFAFTLWVR